jgi:hypothetical protein
MLKTKWNSMRRKKLVLLEKVYKALIKISGVQLKTPKILMERHKVTQTISRRQEESALMTPISIRMRDSYKMMTAGV